MKSPRLALLLLAAIMASIAPLANAIEPNIAYDYETGSGPNFQRYDLQQHGPGVGIAWSF